MTAPFDIVEVQDKKTLKDFIRAPFAAQGGDPNWVPPLSLMKQEDFSPKHPYFQHAEWQPFVAYRNGEPVGRISAQIDRLYHEHHDASTGFFGLIEGIDDPTLFQSLTEAAEYWLRDRGMIGNDAEYAVRDDGRVCGEERGHAGGRDEVGGGEVDDQPSGLLTHRFQNGCAQLRDGEQVDAAVHGQDYELIALRRDHCQRATCPGRVLVIVDDHRFEAVCPHVALPPCSLEVARP